MHFWEPMYYTKWCSNWTLYACICIIIYMKFKKNPTCWNLLTFDRQITWLCKKKIALFPHQIFDVWLNIVPIYQNLKIRTQIVTVSFYRHIQSLCQVNLPMFIVLLNKLTHVSKVNCWGQNIWTDASPMMWKT